MIGTFRGLYTALKHAFRSPVTLNYPDEQPKLSPRFMAHPVLTWDHGIEEPYCTGCLICMRICPTDVITVSMKDNEKFKLEESKRRKIVDDFELDVAGCIMCGLCVEYCNFDAIIMSDKFNEPVTDRNTEVHSLDELLEEGKEQQAKGRWSPPAVKKSQRRSAAQVVKKDGQADTTDSANAPDNRVALAREKATALKASRELDKKNKESSEKGNN
jgi:NADH-quinone oxidoreductase subunit I